MKKNKRILATSCLLITVGLLLWAAAAKCYEYERQVCFQRLTEYTRQIGNEIHEAYVCDRTYLQSIANILAREDLENLENVTDLLSSVTCSGMITRMELLLPGDRLLTSTGDIMDVSGKISYEQEADKGDHISRRSNDLGQPDILILRHYMPIIQNGRTAAVLCGVTDLSELPNLFTATGYENSMQLYLAEGTTGNFLLDTWHDSLDSISVLGSRETKLGYNWEQFNSDISQGKACTMVFRSKKAGEYLYSYTTPAGVEDWMVSLSVPESIIFKQARYMLHSFYGLAALLLMAFTLYFLWLVWEIRREKVVSERELRNVRYMLEVEKELFDVNIHPEHFSTALQKAADFLTAEMSFYWLEDSGAEIRSHLWSSRDCKELEKSDRLALSQEVLPFLRKEGKIISYNLADLGHQLPVLAEKLKENGFHNLMIILVPGLNGEPALILGALNMQYHWDTAGPIEKISLSFSMAVNHYNAYLTLRKMSQIDSLTGLMNRNSYHMALDTLSLNTCSTLACIYIDANGLHEINNHLGHQAGDVMLTTVAEALQTHFPDSGIYRIGGDEFVILSQNQTKENLYGRVDQIRQELRECGYELSIGIEWRNADLNIKSIIYSAENAMQEDKIRYYQTNGKERQLRILNSKVEQMMIEKHDADTFLAVLSPEFNGVYFVDLNKDTIRHLYIPSYFEEMLEEVGDKFSHALLLYAKRIVAPDYYTLFQRICDYEYLETQLNSTVTPEFVYEKTNGSWLKLRILKFKSYTAESRETLWIFSKFDSEAARADLL